MDIDARWAPFRRGRHDRRSGGRPDHRERLAPRLADAGVRAGRGGRGWPARPTGGSSGPSYGPGSARPSEFEAPQPPRFAQAVGLLFAGVGLAGFGLGAQWLGLAATGLALAAAFLNAAFGYCLGCELYLLARRVTVRAE